jgi:hypothetical protein
MSPTPKQVVYREMLHCTLPHLRNISTWPWWRRLRDRSASYEAELVHNLPVSMFDPEFGEQDIWFLNAQARTYCRECSPDLSRLYPEQVKRIRELFSLIPPPLRTKLQWDGPQ